LTWTIEFTKSASKQLKKLDKQNQKRIIKFLKDRLSSSNDPRLLGKPLHGKLSDAWSYRVGDYRLISQLFDDKMIISVLLIGHRSEIYKI
jgi:mRNA interferase RelE/StbE